LATGISPRGVFFYYLIPSELPQDASFLVLKSNGRSEYIMGGAGLASLPAFFAHEHSLAESNTPPVDLPGLEAVFPLYLPFHGVGASGDRPHGELRKLIEELADKYSSFCTFSSLLAKEPLISEEITRNEKPVNDRLWQRALDLSAGVRTFAGELGDKALSLAEKERLEKIELAARASLNRFFFTNASTIERRKAMAAIIAAQVDIDALSHPEVDPVNGWLSYRQTPNSLYVSVQSPFFCVSLQPSGGGSISSFEFKPQRIALISDFEEHPAAGFFCYADGREISATELSFPQHTKDLLIVRFKSKLGAATLYKDFQFHAGVGAHLANSTTGLSLEMWLEGSGISDELLEIKGCFDLGVPSADLIQGQALMCVGGVSQKTQTLDTPVDFSTHEVAGGLYGARMKDRINGLLADFRSSRQLDGVQAKPHPSNDGRLFVTLQTRTGRIVGDNKSITVFFSVV
jgi:hypothetical protein